MKGCFHLKRIASLTVCCLMVCLMTITAFAENSSVSVSDDVISIEEGKTSLETVIEVKTENPYAGVEIGIECPESMVVSEASGSCGSMSAGPVLARGLYWVTFFESDNKLNEPMDITLKVNCDESFTEGDITVKEVNVLTKEGYGVTKETLYPDLKIHVTKENVKNTSETGNTENTDSTSNSTENTDVTDSTKETSNSDETEIPSSSNTDGTQGSSNTTDSSDKNDVPNTGEDTPIFTLLLLSAAVITFGIGFGIKRMKKM